MQKLRSMTGFGRCEKSTDDYRILAELKSVNHRYLDLSIKMPRRFNCFEARIRQVLREYLERGKIDLYLSFETYTDAGLRLKYNAALAAEYMRHFQEMAEQFDISNDAGTAVLSRCQDVLVMEEDYEDDEKLWTLLESAVRGAAAAFREAREKEGESLKNDLLIKLSGLEEKVAYIEAASPSVTENYRARLTEKLRELLTDAGLKADEGRVVTETAIYADKICTDEEMVRIKSHIAAMKNRLLAGGPCGRELDFIAQEMNREANTTLSKASSLSIADTAIALKAEIEKIREQVQNIE